MCLWRIWMTLLEWTQCTEPLYQLTLLQGKSQHRKRLSAFKSILNDRNRKQPRFPDPFQVSSWSGIWGTITEIPSMCHYPKLLPTGWSKFVFSHVAQLIRSTTQIWVVSRMVVLQMVVLRAVATFLAMSLVRIYPGRASL